MTMNEVFRPLLDQCVIVYLDDILIYSPNRAQHLQDIEADFKVLSENRLLTKASKCESLQERLEILGHILSAEGVEIATKKITTIQAWHAPTNLTELQSFLGFVNYVRLFVPDMAKLTAPLTDRLRKGVEYTWGEKEQAAFSSLKQILCSPLVLYIADPHRPFELVANARDIVVGAVLLQDFENGFQTIAYESRKLHPPKRNYLIHDRKMLAIVHAFKVWRCYLTGADVTVRTDHRSLQYFRAQPNLNSRQIRWLDYLESNFHYTVTYKKRRWETKNLAKDQATWRQRRRRRLNKKRSPLHSASSTSTASSSTPIASTSSSRVSSSSTSSASASISSASSSSASSCSSSSSSASTASASTSRVSNSSSSSSRVSSSSASSSSASSSSTSSSSVSSSSSSSSSASSASASSSRVSSSSASSSRVSISDASSSNASSSRVSSSIASNTTSSISSSTSSTSASTTSSSSTSGTSSSSSNSSTSTTSSSGTSSSSASSGRASCSCNATPKACAQRKPLAQLPR
ncbi:unnamed protein product [Closterium sp. NIES-54]